MGDVRENGEGTREETGASAETESKAETESREETEARAETGSKAENESGAETKEELLRKLADACFKEEDGKKHRGIASVLRRTVSCALCGGQCPGRGAADA